MKKTFEIVKVISEWKKRPKNPKFRIRPGHKRVMAAIKIEGMPGIHTRHIDVPINS